MSHPHRGAARALEYLPVTTGSLARQMPAGLPADVLFVLGDDGGVRIDPHAPEFDPQLHQVVFGRNSDDDTVQVHVADGDLEVSRRQGQIYFDGRHWYLENIGRMEVRLPVSRRLVTGDSARLPRAYHPIFLDTPIGGRTYVVEMRVSRRNEARAFAPDTDTTPRNSRATIEEPEGLPDPSLVKPEDRLAVVALARQYLMHLDHPRPLSYEQVAGLLDTAAPETDGPRWTSRVVENRIYRIRQRLASADVTGLSSRDFGSAEPLGNTLNHNLICALIDRGAITPKDLRLLGAHDVPA
ncbi:FHA domain-containing protein [Pseudonocardia phyllosphaerae]|uniref:FHA domain-containing protein n=1 Tax=Pseudonocardia phyllosphaerae TaxID=3390502 RepID=UPI00397D0AF7